METPVASVANEPLLTRSTTDSISPIEVRRPKLAVVLAIDVERERISLGIKQLDGDPFTNYVAIHDKGNIVKGSVSSSTIFRSRGSVMSYTFQRLPPP